MVQDREALEEDLDQEVLDQVALEAMEPGPEGLVQAARAQVYSTQTLYLFCTQQTKPSKQLYLTSVSH